MLQTGSGRSVKGAPVRSLPLAASRVGIHPPARTQEAPGGNRGIAVLLTQFLPAGVVSALLPVRSLSARFRSRLSG